MRAILLMGPQASGKTTWSDKFLVEDILVHYVNSDLWWPVNASGKRVWHDDNGQTRCWHTEPIPSHILDKAYSWAFQQYMEHLRAEQDVLYEATFPDAHTRKRVIREAKTRGYYVEGVFMYPSLLTCVTRNINRKHPVPDKVLARTYGKLELPVYEEGFDKLTIIGEE
jgi:predicted kinase